MAKKKPRKQKEDAPPAKARRDDRIVIRISRHITGPPRRATGDILRMSPADIKRQGLVFSSDYSLVHK